MPNHHFCLPHPSRGVALRTRALSWPPPTPRERQSTAIPLPQLAAVESDSLSWLSIAWDGNLGASGG